MLRDVWEKWSENRGEEGRMNKCVVDGSFSVFRTTDSATETRL